jgi:phosphohistidine phosphatase SixA
VTSIFGRDNTVEGFMRIRIGITCLAVSLGLALGPGPARAQKAVYLARHAEKDGDALTATGKAQAARLASLLKDAGVSVAYRTQAERTGLTAAPLKALLAMQGSDLAVDHADLPDALLNEPDNTSAQDDYARSVLAKIRTDHPNDIVLIIGHTNTVPALIRALGYKSAITIAENEFDRLFLLIPRSDGDTRPPGFFQLRYFAN